MNLRIAVADLLLGVTSLMFVRGDEPNRQQPARIAPDIRERCLVTLRKGIKSDEFWPAMHAAEALALAGAGSEVIAELRDRLPLEQSDQRRCGLARELVRAGDRGRLPVLFQILDDATSTGRVHAAESLYKLAESGDGKSLRAAFEQEKNPQLRLMAAAALARAGHADALTALREQLGSQDRQVRNTVAFALARLGEESDVQPLSNALDRETDAASRAILAGALACLGNARGRDELDLNLNSSDASVRTMAADFAGYSRCVECQSKLVGLLDDSTLDVRVRAAQSLIALSLPAPKR